jgi:5-carboxymethyl-2-hydroxymuconate isomerase
MPHIAIEISPALLAAIDWKPVLHELHVALSGRGWAGLADLKSRMTLISAELCGADPQAQQLIATLTLTNPRPAETCTQMAEMVLDHLSSAIGRHPEMAAWVQCCVFLQEHPKSQYLKRQWNAPKSAVR